MPVIDDNEWARIQAEMQRLQSRAQIADFIEPIYLDPQLNKEAKALIKKKYPQIQIADYDLEEKFNTQINELKQEQKAAEEAKAKAEQQQKWDAKRDKVQKEYGFTEDGMKDLEKYMLDNDIGNYEIAAEHRESKNPKTSDAHHHSGHWDYQKQDGFADIAKDPERWAHDQIYGALLRDQDRVKGR